MRSAFFKTLEERAGRDEDIFILTADLGFKLFDDIKNRCPGRFYDVGIAEANMIGIAAGLSLCGKDVYCYSIIPFLVMRAYEQIRIDAAYHNSNIKLIGVGGGFTYGLEGFTHFGLEDLSLMRSLPNMTIVVPADPFEARCLAKACPEHKGPMYIRLGRSGDPAVHSSSPDFRIGKAIVMNEGKGVAIFAVGNMVHTGQKAVELLKRKGIDATLINMHTLKPLDTGVIKEAAMDHEVIFSLEEHNVNGGLGTAMAEVISEMRYNGFFRRIGIEEAPGSPVGDAGHLRERHGLTAEDICNTVLKTLEEAYL